MTVTSRLLAIAETIDLAHHELCDVAEGLIQATAPTEPAPGLEVAADAPSLVTLPTVDEIAKAIVTDCLKGGPVTGEGWHVTAAKVVLDLLAARVPHWERIAPGTVVKAGTLCRAEHDNPRSNVNEWIHEGGDWKVTAEKGRKVYVDPRTIPAEPEDPALAVVAMWLQEDHRAPDTIPRMADLLARIDAARADA